ncbi:MAG TPA: methyltransferase domain-containing protein [Longimicrobiales bacterium]|nr:methyltransferase domain-containing protein [Longimicrobiales bacterium]
MPDRSASSVARDYVQPRDTGVPWQLKLLSKSLKKQQKLGLLQRQIRDLPGTRRLLITHGDNNGAMNHRLRDSGGEWSWMEMEPDAVPTIEQLLDEPVLLGAPGRLPVEDASFDVVIALDVQEHLRDPESFNRELVRIVKPGGHVVATTPNGDPWKPVSVLRRALGMTKEKYGHVVYGYNVRQHQDMLRKVGFQPVASGSYSGFFTELIELAINFTYTTLLSRGKTKRREGEIAPSTQEKLKAVEKQYRAYALVYPMLLAFSKLDVLAPLGHGYAVSVVGRRPE